MAVRVTAPEARAVKTPLVLTVPTDVSLTVQVTCDVRSFELPSLYTPVAENC
jgi:hypothetical protein